MRRGEEQKGVADTKEDVNEKTGGMKAVNFFVQVSSIVDLKKIWHV